jgi:hypothetical protein
MMFLSSEGDDDLNEDAAIVNQTKIKQNKKLILVRGEVKTISGIKILKLILVFPTTIHMGLMMIVPPYLSIMKAHASL